MTTTETTTTTPVLKFERETCGRCGGSGSYSYCQRYGSTCFGCAGSGVRLTKRGAAASQWLIARLQVRAEDAKVGQRLLDSVVTVNGVGNVWRTVESVEVGEEHVVGWSGTGDARVEHKGRTVLIRWRGKAEATGYTGISFRRRPTAEELAEAIAYQGTLTKLGKPRKAG